MPVDAPVDAPHQLNSAHFQLCSVTWVFHYSFTSREERIDCRAVCDEKSGLDSLSVCFSSLSEWGGGGVSVLPPSKPDLHIKTHHFEGHGWERYLLQGAITYTTCF